MTDTLAAFLDQHALIHQRFEHPPVFTCEEASRLCPAMPGAETKNLFLCDNKGKRHFLLSMPAENSVDLKALAPILEVKSLRMASPERLLRYLGLTPGAVTLLAAFNDAEHAVEVVIDQALWTADAVLSHPLVNTATLSLPHDSLARFFTLTGHVPRIIDVPQPG
ncbi:prolyl-tRNA synthetase associated domain-containing protein [Craterilacuibacter sp. RT1T]|uniref:prolyl-tRNA synthetase associated domain-containing protein n=1 Tax=Craterilacuibacter sp. RT1T TaxID=2942211 RepID=UPI0020C08BFB|nr:prolyl-tRNA synthetase associated domain-containing protein [Craterilacuibacter sp. RT1T]MCL6262672.1 prolyl-tRNA synthetase associated domain-containing protein [Craterilacuibacter sp. RT1T]